MLVLVDVPPQFSGVGGCMTAKMKLPLKSLALQAVVEPFVMPATPDVLSIGRRCVKHGLSFWWPPWSKRPVLSPPKGKGKQTGKNSPVKGSGKKGTAWTPPAPSPQQQVWCKTDSNGNQYCTQYQLGKCKFGNQCRNSHNCPVDIGGGWPCDKRHMAKNHK